MDRPEICGDEPILLNRLPQTNELAHTVASYLVGIAGFRPGLDGNRMLRALTKNNHAHLRQLVPWRIPTRQAPEAYWDDKLLYFAIPWPRSEQSHAVKMLDECAQSVTVADGSRKFILGSDTYGSTVTLEFARQLHDYHQIAHLLVGGQSGFGKSNTARIIAVQCARHDGTRSVLIDAGGGKSLGAVNGIPGQAGPLATTLPDALDAMYWVYQRMQERNRQVGWAAQNHEEIEFDPIMVYASEFDGFARASSAFATMLESVARRGRSAGVHLVAESQATKAKDFGDAPETKRQMSRLALKTADQYATSALLPPGCELKPHRTLVAPGDGYLVTARRQNRLLVAYLDTQAFEQYTGVPPDNAWPQFDAAGVNGIEGGEFERGPEFTPHQLIVGATSSKRGWSRSETRDALNDVTGQGMGSSRIDNELASIGRELSKILDELGYCS